MITKKKISEVSLIIDNIKNEAINKKNHIKKNQDRINELNEEIDQFREKLETLIDLQNAVLKEYEESPELSRGNVLSKSLISDLLSKDKEISTDAHVINPWMTEEYNKEREKLFYLALQMTKQFVLSSRSCKWNLLILGQYWGLRTEKGSGKIKFKPEDREVMMGSLFNTLCLLVPVVSSTFASVGRLLRDITAPGEIGIVIIDEAGQAQPQMAVGPLYRARKAIIVGDPKQVEPVVTDDLKLLKDSYKSELLDFYKNKTISVQKCADNINPIGTYYYDDNGYEEWVGCPLVVHRRCIDPMCKISNEISYNELMKNKTIPPSLEKSSNFILTSSAWIDVVGKENGSGDHYVPEQGAIVCELLEQAFEKNSKPNLYVITPFSNVAKALKEEIWNYCQRNRKSSINRSKYWKEWIKDNISTVHKFQGKEADEVVFVLGCDKNCKNSYAVVNFVNSNIVNVAVTRAKYRLYVVGDQDAWGNNPYIMIAASSLTRLTKDGILNCLT